MGRRKKTNKKQATQFVILFAAKKKERKKERKKKLCWDVPKNFWLFAQLKIERFKRNRWPVQSPRIYISYIFIFKYLSKCISSLVGLPEDALFYVCGALLPCVARSLKTFHFPRNPDEESIKKKE